jgi:hypothetical protein
VRVPLQLGKQSGEALSPPVSSERLLNGYLEQTPQGREPTPVYGTPGFTAFATTGAVRGLLAVADRLFAVNATDLVEISSSGVVTTLGTIPAGTVDMASDGTNVVVTCANEIYVWNGTTLAAVTDPDAPDASSVEYLNGFYVFTETNAEQFFISPQNNPGGDYDALDFDSADTSPDKLVRTRRVGRDLILFGKRSVEFWYYSGDSTFPISRYQDTPLDVGLIGVRAEAATNETVFWIASDKTVRRLDGRTATRVSTFAIEKEIESWADASLTIAAPHVWQGHLFIVFRNPDGCVVLDQATNLWHERASYGSDTWSVPYYAYAHGKHLVGGAQVYELGGYDEAGDVLPFEMVTPWIDNQGERFSINSVEVRLEAGVGSQTLDPKISLSRTEDGEEYTTPLMRSYGKQGDRFRRVTWSSQGMSRGCAFKLRITDAAKRAIFASYVEID